MNDKTTGWEQAVAALQSGKVAEAEAIMRGLVADGAAEPRHRDLLAKLIHNRAVGAFRDGGIDVAESLLREALTLKPDLQEARAGLAELLFRRALRRAAATEWMEAAQSIWKAASQVEDLEALLGPPAAALADRLHQLGKASIATEPILACRTALAAWALVPRKDYYATARSLFIHLGTGELGKPTDAGEFEAILRRDPEDLMALLGLANLRRRAGRLNEAESLCRTALQHWPRNPFAQGRLACVLVGQTRHQEADRVFRDVGERHGGLEAVIRLSPDFVDMVTAPVADISAVARSVEADLVVFAGCDAGYFHRFADAFANSVARYAGAVRLHLHVVDPDAEVPARLQAMQQRLPELPISITTEAVPEALTAEQRRTYFACARFLRLPEILAAYGVPVLMLDVDAVILRSVQPLLERMTAESADLSLIVARAADPWGLLWADAVLAAPSPRAIRYFESVRRYIAHFLNSGQAVWFLDQVALFAVWVTSLHGGQGLRMIEWPTDIQNSDTRHAYFWSLHVSQPTNAAGPESDLYRRFKENTF